MSDLIDRQQAINVIERMRAYIGHNMERAVGAAFIEILDDVGEDIGRLPSIQFATDTNVGTKLGTNLAQLCPDCHNRPPNGVHFNPQTAFWLHRIGQEAYERKMAENGLNEAKARQAFMERYGKNYL